MFVPQCPGGTFTPSMKSTKDYPDEVINFMRAHPLMFHAVYPTHRRPLVLRTNVNYRFTTVAVDQVDAADGRYEVLFLGTGTHAAHRGNAACSAAAPEGTGTARAGQGTVPSTARAGCGAENAPLRALPLLQAPGCSFPGPMPSHRP